MLFLLVFPTAVLAKHSVEVNTQIDEELEASETASVSASEDQLRLVCDSRAHWKNHGEFVSCVAKLHPTDNGAITAAARSDIGKENEELNDSASNSASLSAQLKENNNLLLRLNNLLQQLLDRIRHFFK